jgi:hypothetical protein
MSYYSDENTSDPVADNQLEERMQQAWENQDEDDEEVESDSLIDALNELALLHKPAIINEIYNPPGFGSDWIKERFNKCQ